MSDKKSKTVSDAPRRNVFMERPEDLVLITDEAHPLYDPRVNMPVEESMVRNIMTYGVKEPVLVRKVGGSVEVVAGRQRVKAALEANRRFASEGKAEMRVPAIYQNGSDGDMYGILISENEARVDDDPLGKAKKAKTYIDMGYTESEAAVAFCVTTQTIKNWMAVLNLSTPVQKAVERREITPTAASKLANLEPEAQKVKLVEMKEAGGKLTVERVARVAKGEDAAPPKKIRTRTDIENHLSNNEDDDSEYGQGYADALRWVLCLEKPVAVAE